MSEHDELDADSVRAIFNERPALEERLIHFLSCLSFNPEWQTVNARVHIISAVHSKVLLLTGSTSAVDGNAANEGAQHTCPSLGKNAQSSSSSCAKYLVPQDLGQHHETSVVQSGRNDLLL
mmetsp:Transcript_57492/g.84337  ORF Transcript_57492/g.84337 Transcript_57492/m.84337 type:complete len:121 (+) Transcript_57492:76-438(+)